MAQRRNAINVRKIERPNGSVIYRARLCFPFDEEKGYKPKDLDFYAKTEKEAVALRSAYKPVEEGKELDKKSSIGTFLVDTFLPKQEERIGLAGKQGLSLTVYRSRKGRIQNYIIGTPFADTILGYVKPEMVEAFFASLGKKKVSAEVQHQLRADLRLAFKTARKLIPQDWRNYFDFEDYQLPAIESKSLDEKFFFDTDFILGVCANEELNLKYRTMLFFQLVMNCRPSEMFALTWDKINFQKNEVLINKATRLTPEGYKILAPKTGEKGIRVVDMPQALADMLQALQKQSNGSEWVFTDHNEQQLHKDRFADLWPKMKKELGLPDGPGFYSLKTSGNSLALASGIAPEIQAKRMGHTSARMALSAYRKVTAADKTASAVWDKLALPKGTNHPL